MFICGSRSFGHEDEDDFIKSTYPISKRSRRSLSFGSKNVGRDNQSKNPYAERGLDKFYALLAELDEKKQKIYSESGSEDIAFVRFVYSHDSDRVRPIIVRVKDNKKQEKNIRELIKNRITSNPEKSENKSPKAITSHEETVAKDGSNERKLKKETSLRRINTGFKVNENLRKPYYYMAIYVMLVLLLLAIYGRAFAILCTSIGWYTVPTIVEGTSSSSTSSKRKKEYVRKQSDHKKVLLTSEGPSSPKSVINGLS